MMRLPRFRRNLTRAAGRKGKLMQRKSGVSGRVADLCLDAAAKAAATAVRAADNGYSRPIERFLGRMLDYLHDGDNAARGLASLGNDPRPGGDGSALRTGGCLDPRWTPSRVMWLRG
jgi:hypothetical protein